ncbi:hypothetical protein SC936_07300 [Aggregatibacter actinomycetemcomitans serotype e str. SC936]|nr:hypothetical protein SC936_07300 [Aggregatibacter actinomycetemcomitans serotype e str. SC936]
MICTQKVGLIPNPLRFFMTKYNQLFKRQLIDFYLQHNIAIDG